VRPNPPRGARVRMRPSDATVRTRRFDPLAAVVSDGKRQELQVLTRKVQMMRAEAAVKAWARVAALLSDATQSASKEYAGALCAQARASSGVSC
jgi:hypothetical protein